MGNRRLRGLRRAAASGVWLGMLAVTGMPQARAQSVSAPPEAAAPIVVSASRLPTPASAVASSVTVITAEDIRRRQFRSVSEALSSVPSLSVVRSGAVGKTAAVFTRGANAQHTLFLLDGIEMNDPSHPSSAFDPAHVLLEDIERIEVLLGPQGPLYGSDAVGGVVSIITKRGRGAPVLSASVEAGAFSTFAQSASVRGRADRLDYAFGLQHLESDGISALPARFRQADGTLDDDEHENATLSARLGATLTERLSVDLSGRYTFTRDGTDARVLAVGDDSDSVSRSNRYYLGGNVRLALFEGLTEHRLGVVYTDVSRRDRNYIDPVNPFDELRDDNRGRRLKVDLQNDLYAGEHHVVTLGLETEEERTRSGFVSPGFASAVSAEVRTSSLYLQDQFTYLERVSGTVGARLDDHSSFGAQSTWRAALAYRHPESATRVRASYGTGFKAPSLVQLFGASASVFGTFTGNPDLQPEESRGWDAGIEQSFLGGRARLGATYFENDIENLIVAGATTNMNIGSAQTRGVELDAYVELGAGFALDLGYALVRSEDTATGAELLRRPLHKANVDLRWRSDAGTSLSLAGTLIGHRFDIDAATFARIERGSEFVLDLTGAYRVHPNVELFGRVENLLDRSYEEPDGFQQPGIAGYAGLRATLP